MESKQTAMSSQGHDKNFVLVKQCDWTMSVAQRKSIIDPRYTIVINYFDFLWAEMEKIWTVST